MITFLIASNLIVCSADIEIIVCWHCAVSVSPHFSFALPLLLNVSVFFLLFLVSLAHMSQYVSIVFFSFRLIFI